MRTAMGRVSHLHNFRSRGLPIVCQQILDIKAFLVVLDTSLLVAYLFIDQAYLHIDQTLPGTR